MVYGMYHNKLIYTFVLNSLYEHVVLLSGTNFSMTSSLLQLCHLLKSGLRSRNFLRFLVSQCALCMLWGWQGVNVCCVVCGLGGG